MFDVSDNILMTPGVIRICSQKHLWRTDYLLPPRAAVVDGDTKCRSTLSSRQLPPVAAGIIGLLVLSPRRHRCGPPEGRQIKDLWPHLGRRGNKTSSCGGSVRHNLCPKLAVLGPLCGPNCKFGHKFVAVRPTLRR